MVYVVVIRIGKNYYIVSCIQSPLIWTAFEPVAYFDLKVNFVRDFFYPLMLQIDYMGFRIIAEPLCSTLLKNSENFKIFGLDTRLLAKPGCITDLKINVLSVKING